MCFHIECDFYVECDSYIRLYFHLKNHEPLCPSLRHLSGAIDLDLEVLCGYSHIRRLFSAETKLTASYDKAQLLLKS